STMFTPWVWTKPEFDWARRAELRTRAARTQRARRARDGFTAVRVNQAGRLTGRRLVGRPARADCRYRAARCGKPVHPVRIPCGTGVTWRLPVGAGATGTAMAV